MRMPYGAPAPGIAIGQSGQNRTRSQVAWTSRLNSNMLYSFLYQVLNLLQDMAGQSKAFKRNHKKPLTCEVKITTVSRGYPVWDSIDCFDPKFRAPGVFLQILIASARRVPQISEPHHFFSFYPSPERSTTVLFFFMLAVSIIALFVVDHIITAIVIDSIYESVITAVTQDKFIRPT